MMNLQQLRVLLAIRDEGSLNRAAERLGYGVPTVTHHLRTLESHLRVRLVDRSRHGTRLTALGESFAAEVDSVLAGLDRAERIVTAQRDAGAVTVRIGSFPSIGSRLLPAAIAELRARTSVRVEVVEAEPSEVVRMLQAGEVHAGIIYDIPDLPEFTGPDLRLSTLLDEPYRIMVAADGELAKREILDVADMADVDWIVSRNEAEASVRVLKRVCRSLGHELRELMRSDDLSMIHGLVAEGLGCALSTEAAVDTDFAVVLRPAVQDLGQRRVSFVTRTGSVPAAVTWLRESLAAVAAERGTASAGE
ncbi:DNA-binding transcriptional regulator, LysR family [Brevibacterium siliguriense]|uniref:DNA-binding transcriptional regulator, LysR family n=1 Tax=Brevibacterium siliguriense TaxID=1136497 RepID=A0A1H1MD42_9MICO|nr:LysR family transcriptional regulator [Brevibacterium siliguriense]SDR84570.1 DNA-binding transcriptional regulator, LysR family [Brevibacterium siliguriense]